MPKPKTTAATDVLVEFQRTFAEWDAVHARMSANAENLEINADVNALLDRRCDRVEAKLQDPADNIDDSDHYTLARMVEILSARLVDVSKPQFRNTLDERPIARLMSACLGRQIKAVG